MPLMKRMITPIAIEILYVLGLICTVLMSGFMLFGALSSQGEPAIFVAVQGLGLLLIGPILIRIMCELILVVFRIYEKLESIDNKLALLAAGKLPAK